jgi:hypothetical protein
MAGIAGLIGLSWAASLLLRRDNIKPVDDTEEEEIDMNTVIKSKYTRTATELAQLIVSKEIPPIDYSDFNIIETQPRPADKEVVDFTREYKDISTDIVVKHFLSTDKSMYNFLKLVYGTYHNSLEEYKRLRNLHKWDVFFVYKGGNVLRIISNDFLKEMPRVASKKIQKYYEQFFKRSDADFSIYIRPDLPKYDEIYNELVALSYLLQVKIRSEFMANLTKFFDFFKYNIEYQTEILKSYYDKVMTSTALNDVDNTKFYRKEFNGIVFGDVKYPENLTYSYKKKMDKGIQFKNEDTIVSFELNPEKTMMVIQSNETLDFEAGGSRTKFTLVRTKVNFDYYFDNELYQIGGELIDVSLPHRLDDNIGHFFEHRDYTNQYQLSYGDDILRFYSYSLKYLISDLEYILFKFVNLPWLTPKYEKRLNRLFYLYFIDTFVVLKGNTPRRNLIFRMRSIFKKRLNQESLKADVGVIRRAIRDLNLHPKLEMGKMMDALDGILDVLLKQPDTEDISSYNYMMDVLIENCDFVLSTFDGIEEFCSIEGNINLKVLYDNEFSSLI